MNFPSWVFFPLLLIKLIQSVEGPGFKSTSCCFETWAVPLTAHCQSFGRHTKSLSSCLPGAGEVKHPTLGVNE